MSESENSYNGEDCPRCGSLLPDAEEGVCMTCGYEYGRATLYMPVVKLSDIQKADDPIEGLFEDPAPSSPAAVSAPKVPFPTPEQSAPQDNAKKGLMVILLVAVIMAAIAVIALIVSVVF